jgi:hypothetical protein
MTIKNIKTYRIYFGLITIPLFFGVVFFIAKLWFYFNSGADRSKALNIPPDLPETHRPVVNWLPDDPNTGRVMEGFTRGQIMKDYIRAWYQQHLGYLNLNTDGLKEYFTPRALPKIKHNIKLMEKEDFFIHQTDLEHKIKLHFYSADGQIVSFTDHDLKLKQRYYDKKTKKKIFEGERQNDYLVVMLLDDGYWRIKNMVRLEPSNVKYTDTTTIVKPEGLVSIKADKYFEGSKEFFPKGVNYYPQKTPWNLFWKEYDTKVISKDFGIIHKMGFNTVRIFVNYHDFNKGNIPDERLLQLQDLLDNAEKHKLKVIVTLFDFLGDYSLLNLTASDRHLETILKKFRSHPAVFAWDLKNEPDLDYNYHDKTDVNEWIEMMLKNAKKYDPNHLVTLGWAFPENASFLFDKVDFVSFHSYRTIDELSSGIDKLKAMVKNKPLMLEEFGMSTYKGLWAPRGKNTEDQKQYFTEVKQVLNKKGRIPMCVWTLYDFTHIPNEVVGKMPWNKNPQKGFGLITSEGKIKAGTKILLK